MAMVLGDLMFLENKRYKWLAGLRGIVQRGVRNGELYIYIIYIYIYCVFFLPLYLHTQTQEDDEGSFSLMDFLIKHTETDAGKEALGFRQILQ